MPSLSCRIWIANLYLPSKHSVDRTISPGLHAYFIVPIFLNVVVSSRANVDKVVRIVEPYRGGWSARTLSLQSFFSRSIRYQISILNGLTRPGLVLNSDLFPSPTVNQKALLLVACQVQIFGNLEPCSAEIHVSSHSIAIDSKGWHVSLFCGQPGDCLPKGGSRCFAYVSTVSGFL